MLLSSLPIDKLKKFEFPTYWGHGNPETERHFFYDEQFFYKIWSPVYTVKDMVIDGGRYVKHCYKNPSSGIAAIDLGFINQETCPALVDLIWNDGSVCCGYITKLGTPLKDVSQITPEFFELICNFSIKTGFAHSDFVPKNILMIDEKLSLIDIDTVLSHISNMDINFDLMHGSMRPHVATNYKLFLLDILFHERISKPKA